MIKLPKEVNRIIKALEGKGFAAYAVGGCVRDSLLGNQPLDWDLATSATLDKLKDLFPEAKVISQKLSVLRFDYTTEGDEDGIIVDLATFRTEGTYSDFRRPDTVEFTENVEDDLKRRDFTVNAMADNPDRPMIDLYDGREDIKNRIIRTVGDAETRFEEDPLRMLRAVRFAAELDFTLHKSVQAAILKKGYLLANISVDRIRWEFEKIMISEHAGKGLQLLAGADLMVYIVGRERAVKMTRREMNDFMGLTENIDKTMQVLERRLGLLYICFDKKRGLAAIEMLNYDSQTKQHLLDAMHLMEKIHFLADKHEMKEFLVRYGKERYEYLHNLSKAQRIVYDMTDIKIQNRIYMMDDIIKNKEPVYIEDLAIDGNDLMEEGIAEGEKIGELLVMLTDMVHRKPKENNREDLLNYARQFVKNPGKATFRKVKWLR